MGKNNKSKRTYKDQEEISTDLEDRYFSKQGYGAALEEIGGIIASVYEKLPYFLNKCSDLLNAFGGVDGKEINKEYQAKVLSDDAPKELEAYPHCCELNPMGYDEGMLRKQLNILRHHTTYSKMPGYNISDDEAKFLGTCISNYTSKDNSLLGEIEDC